MVVEVARRRWASWGRLCCGGVRRRPAASPNAPSKPKQARHDTENLTGRADALNRLPETAWTPAYDGDGEPREGADVAELTGLLNMTGWPARTRVIARREVPHPGAQLRPVECNGRRITCFPPTPAAGNSRPKLRHRRRARAEDRIRCAKDTGLPNLPLHDAASNAVWLAIVLLACDLLTWTLTPLSGPLRVAEPKTLRLRLHAIAGRLTRSGAANPATAGPALALGRHGRRRRSDHRSRPDDPRTRGPGTTPRRDSRQ